MKRIAWVLLLTALWALSGCSTRYVNRDGDTPHTTYEMVTPKVGYRLVESAWTPTPTCIAVLPPTARDADAGKLELVRRGLFAHLAPKGYRQAPMPQVDDWFARRPPELRSDRVALGRDLQCGHILETTVNVFEKGFFAFFSDVRLGAKTRLIRASDGVLLWEAEHIAQLQDGGLPISPIGAAASVFSAGRNMADEQSLRIVDDLARRLLNTLPDARPAMPETVTPQLATAPHWKTDLDAWLASLPEMDRETALHELSRRSDLDTVQQEAVYTRLSRTYDKPRYWREWAQARLDRNDNAGALEVIEQARTRAPDEAETHYLAGRILSRIGRLDEADASLVTAIAKAGDRADYYESLASISARRGQMPRARAALEKVIRLDATRPYAWYNLAVMDFNSGDYTAALESFSNAARRYGDRGQLARAEQIIRELDDLRPHLGAHLIQTRQENLRAALKSTSPSPSTPTTRSTP